MPAVAAIAVAVALILLAAIGGVTQEQQLAAACGLSPTADPLPPTTSDTRVGAPLPLRPGEVVPVAATSYGGTTGAITGYPGQENLPAHPDTFAELSTLARNPYPSFTFSDADALGGLPYMTALRVSRGGRALVLYKRDIGFGQGANTLGGHPARIDVYQPAAAKLGISYSMVDISLAPRTGAANLLAETPAAQSDNQLAPQVLPDPMASSAGAALNFIQRRAGRISFALVQPDGTLVAGYRPDMPFHGASLTKAMILVALTRAHASSAIAPGDLARADLMIRQSDNASANALLRSVGAGAIEAVARSAGMRDIELSTRDRQYVLGDSRVTALDQARFFARIDELLAARHRAWALGLLATEQAGDWGLLNAGLPGAVYAKAGWRPDAGGWTVTQGAQFGTPALHAGIAVLTDGNPSERYGQESIAGLAHALLTQRGAVGSACAAQTIGSGPLPLTPGSRARILPSGEAAAPQDAPAQVKQIIAAANQIVAKPYVYGGGHGMPLAALAPSYDCSSSVSHALYGAGLIGPVPQASGELESFGAMGPGRWVTIEASLDHVYMYVAGLRFDTSPHGAASVPPGSGPRWRAIARSDAGFVTRHPVGL